MDVQAVVVADLLADLLAAAGGAHFSAAAPPGRRTKPGPPLGRRFVESEASAAPDRSTEPPRTIDPQLPGVHAALPAVVYDAPIGARLAGVS